MEASGEVGRASGPLQEAITLARAVVGVGSPSRTVLAPTRLVAAGGSSSERKLEVGCGVEKRRRRWWVMVFLLVND